MSKAEESFYTRGLRGLYQNLSYEMQLSRAGRSVRAGSPVENQDGWVGLSMLCPRRGVTKSDNGAYDVNVKIMF